MHRTHIEYRVEERDWEALCNCGWSEVKGTLDEACEAAKVHAREKE